jgi:Domain of unknown function (DUF222)/HNH endonuclease
MIQFAASASLNATGDPKGTAAATASHAHTSTELLGDEIARLAAHLHAATYRLLVLIREFEEREGWAVGFRSCADWLGWRTGIAPGAAREKVRVARALASLPLISTTMERGALSFSKVRAMTRVASPENEADLVEVAAHATAAQMERIVRAWRRVDRLEDAGAEAARHESRYLRVHHDEDGMYVVRGRLDPEVGALLEKALEAAADALYRGASVEERAETTVAQRRADAVGLLAERALRGPAAGGSEGCDAQDARPTGRADRYQVVLHVGSDARADAGGLHVSAETSRRLACDAGLVVMTHDAHGRALDVGRKRRTVPAALRRALEGRDPGCRFPGCGIGHTDAHHITHWAVGGHTRMDNLVLLCRRHHRAVHEAGWTVRLTEEGRAVFHRPDGRRLPEVPASPAVPSAPAAALAQAHRTLGIEPDAWTATPDGFGEELDLGLAIELLRGWGRAADDSTGCRHSC